MGKTIETCKNHLIKNKNQDLIMFFYYSRATITTSVLKPLHLEH